jgi:hypothetical protein
VLGVDIQTARKFENELIGGIEVVRPGFTRISLSYHSEFFFLPLFFSAIKLHQLVRQLEIFPFSVDDPTLDYIIKAVVLIARKAHRLLPQ